MRIMFGRSPVPISPFLSIIISVYLALNPLPSLAFAPSTTIITTQTATASTASASTSTLSMSMSSAQSEKTDSTHTDAPFRIGYVTDVEGNLDYFRAFVAKSNVLDVVDSGNEKELLLTLRDNCHFVFGGDAVDKGTGDIRFCRALVSLKQRYPDRVHLLVGNRDLNKLRFSAELSEADMNRGIADIPPPHWDPKAPTLREFLQVLQKEDQNSSLTLDDLNTRTNRLRYMLQHTLGCPKTFEFRRQELSLLRSCHVRDISDEQVVDNFLYEADHPDGSLRQYLENAQVAAVVGNTLFVHGAVDVDTMKFVPALDSKFENPTSKAEPGMTCDNLFEWVDGLNDFLKQGLIDHRKRPTWDAERTTRGGEALMALQNRPAMWGRSIISNCYGDGGVIITEHALAKRNDPKRLDQAKHNPMVFEGISSDPRDPVPARWMLDHGIRRVVVGHKPTGDSPAVLSASYTGVEIVSGDTSFSDTTSEDNRGSAVAVVEIAGDSSESNRLVLSGIFASGSDYSCAFPMLRGDKRDGANGGVSFGQADRTRAGTEWLLGTQLDDGWWIKAATSTKYHLSRGKGREVEYKTIDYQMLQSHDLQGSIL